jgi:hypothetical protein
MSPPERTAAWRAARLHDKGISLLEEMADSLAHLNLDVTGPLPPPRCPLSANGQHTRIQVRQLSCVHVAGTKGKGSTCAFVESVLRRGYGLRTGLYTSPNLVHVRYAPSRERLTWPAVAR